MTRFSVTLAAEVVAEEPVTLKLRVNGVDMLTLTVPAGTAARTPVSVQSRPGIAVPRNALLSISVVAGATATEYRPSGYLECVRA